MSIVALFVLAASLISFEVSGAHAPPANDDWNCYYGPNDPPPDGLCWSHWPNAQRDWHFSGTVPANVQTIVRGARAVWTTGHQLNAPENSASPNHVYWEDTSLSYSCGWAVACMNGLTYSDTNQHILMFELRFDSTYTWNMNPFVGHGSFTGLDFPSVAVHEWGHTMGIGHSLLGAQHDCGTATASNIDQDWATMTQGIGGCHFNGHLEQRDLHAVDVEARCHIYEHAHNYPC